MPIGLKIKKGEFIIPLPEQFNKKMEFRTFFFFFESAGVIINRVGQSYCKNRNRLINQELKKNILTLPMQRSWKLWRNKWVVRKS